MITSRTDFNETWLSESPSGLGSFETFNMLVYNIKDIIQHGFVPKEIANDLYKIETSTSLYYWYEKDNIILLGIELDKKPQGLIVLLLGKNPNIRGQEPYASDLYSTILDDQPNSIRIVSDKQLSNEGFDLWKRLFSLGKAISVYDKNNPGKTFETFKSLDEMEKYFENDNLDFSRYQYVLSKNGQPLGETRNHFNNRRYRELAGIMLED